MHTVLILGLVSLFTDISSEMVYPLLSLYLTTTLGATPAIVGIIEGIAESLASLLKTYSGYISDKTQKRKPLALLGYGSAKWAFFPATATAADLAHPFQPEALAS